MEVVHVNAVEESVVSACLCESDEKDNGFRLQYVLKCT